MSLAARRCREAKWMNVSVQYEMHPVDLGRNELRPPRAAMISRALLVRHSLGNLVKQIWLLSIPIGPERLSEDDDAQ